MHELLAAAASVLRASPHLALDQTAHHVLARWREDVVIEVHLRGSAVTVGTPSYLEVRPGQSERIRHLASSRPEWDLCETTSEWHVRKIAHDVVADIDRRAALPAVLAATISGRAKEVPLGPDEPEYWKQLAHWSKESGFLEPMSRRFAFRYGELIERGLPMSDRYRAWANRTAKAAKSAGFRPPSKTVATSNDPRSTQTR